jgi:hypothetical protein
VLVVLFVVALDKVLSYEINLFERLIEDTEYLVNYRLHLQKELENTQDVESKLKKMDDGVDVNLLKKRIKRWKESIDEPDEDDDVEKLKQRVKKAQEQLKGGANSDHVVVELLPHATFLPELKIKLKSHLAAGLVCVCCVVYHNVLTLLCYPLLFHFFTYVYRPVFGFE